MSAKEGPQNSSVPHRLTWYYPPPLLVSAASPTPFDRHSPRTETEYLDLVPQVVRDVEAWLAVRGGRGEDGMFVQIKRDKIQRHLQLTDGAMWYILRKRGREAGLKRPLRPSPWDAQWYY